jgi:hypothetical protein
VLSSKKQKLSKKQRKALQKNQQMNQDRNAQDQQHDTLEKMVDSLHEIYSEVDKELIADIFYADGQRNVNKTRKMLDDMTADAHKYSNVAIAKPMDPQLVQVQQNNVIPMNKKIGGPVPNNPQAENRF